MNENESTAVCLCPSESLVTDENKTEDTATSSALSTDIKESDVGVETTQTLPEHEKKSYFVQSALRFVFIKLLPIALALFSAVITLALFASHLGELDISAEKLVRIMIGDFAGGVDYVVDAEGGYPSPLPGSPELESDGIMGTADKNLPPNDSTSNLTLIQNETPYSPDLEVLADLPRVIPPLDDLYEAYGDGAPIVLIIHTHGTESYADTATGGYRSLDKEKNIIAVGKVIADKLQGEGISTIHCTEIFDSPDFGMAYYNASQAIRSYINEYPSISYVLDIHRDSIELEDGTSYAPTSVTSQGRAAQIMFVIGTDHGGSDHSGWENNLSLAARLQSSVSRDYPSLMRSINLRSASFNEQYTKGSLLIEVGATASTLDEAKLSAEILAEYLAREIKG